jgi:hypothetical protein
MSETKKYEYCHYVLGPEVHFGKHSAFGDHVAIGTGASSLHIYRNRIFIGNGEEIKLTPSQTMLVSRILKRIEDKVDEQLLLERLELEHKET